jgi:myo-inositol-1(or 4)-monophosphatase
MNIENVDLREKGVKEPIVAIQQANDGLVVPPRGMAMSVEMQFALEAARRAGEVVRSMYGRLLTVDEKGRGDLVCEADRASEKVAVDYLSQVTPGYSILAEEGSGLGTSPNKMRWIIDPLDGSSAFIFKAGAQYPSVLIALEANHEVKLGVCLFPLTGEWFFAEKDKGAFKDGIALPLVSSPNSLKECWVSMNHYGDISKETEYFKQIDRCVRGPGGARLVTRDVPHSGAAMRLLDGSSSVGVIVHDNSIDSPKQQKWDIAAIKLILEEAGATMLNADVDMVGPSPDRPIVASLSQEIAYQVANFACDVDLNKLKMFKLKTILEILADQSSTSSDIFLQIDNLWQSIRAVVGQSSQSNERLLMLMEKVVVVQSCMYQMDVAERYNGDSRYHYPFLERAKEAAAKIAEEILNS